jgi:hypothetical protein
MYRRWGAGWGRPPSRAATGGGLTARGARVRSPRRPALRALTSARMGIQGRRPRRVGDISEGRPVDRPKAATDHTALTQLRKHCATLLLLTLAGPEPTRSSQARPTSTWSCSRAGRSTGTSRSSSTDPPSTDRLAPRLLVHWCHGSGWARLGSRCLAGRSSSRLPTVWVGVALLWRAVLPGTAGREWLKTGLLCSKKRCPPRSTDPVAARAGGVDGTGDHRNRSA